MNTHVDKNLESKNHSAANGISQQQTGRASTFQLVDNRPESIAQRKLQEIADNSPQAMQLKSIQLMANNAVIQREKAIGAYMVNTNANLRRDGWPYKPIQVVPAGTPINVINKGRRQENFSLGGIFGTKHHHSWVQLANGVVGWIEDSNLSTPAKYAGDQLATNTMDRLKGGRHGAELGISATPAYAPGDYRRALACYNFAVGSFNHDVNERQLQASVPEYVSHRYGLAGTVLSQVQARANTVSGAITGARAAAIDNLMHAAGMSIIAGQHNPDWFGAQGAALRVRLKMPLQKYILRQSGFEPNPEGNWAIGFRGTPTELGSDHAWLKAIDPRHPNRYITFDTFPANPGVQANRKRHADPYRPRVGEADFEIKVTGPTLPQQAIIGRIPDVAPVPVETNTDDRTNLHPDNY